MARLLVARRILTPAFVFVLGIILTACGGGGGGSKDNGNNNGGNTAPTANAGSDQSVVSGTSVTLSGTGSDNEGSVTYQWSQTSGTAVTLVNATSASASFTAPVVESNTVLEFTLTVTDSHGVSTTDKVLITVSGSILSRFIIGGTIEGNDASVTLSLNGSEETFTTTPFAFTATVEEGENYAVLFVSTPNNQHCSLQNNAGTASDNVSNIIVTCSDPITVLSYADAQMTGHMSSGDFNADGFTDLVFSIRTLAAHNAGADQVMYRIAYGNGTGGFTTTFSDIASLGEIGSGRRGHQIITGDFNGDSVTDFAASGGNILEIYAGSATQTHSMIYRNFNLNAPYGEPLYSLDANHDNALDLIILDYTDLYFYENVSGAFENRTALNNRPTISPMNYTLADFNNDGEEDILILGIQDFDALELGLFSGNGDGSFNPPSSLITLSDDLYLGQNLSEFPQDHKDIAYGDFNADGDLDIVITSTTDFLQVMSNDGSGNFTAAQRVNVGEAPIHVQVADINLDQIPDLVSVNLEGKTITIHYGIGDGSFGDSNGADAGWLEIELENDVDPYDLNITDLNGDLYPDIVLAEIGTRNLGVGSIQIFLSPGAP